MFDRYRHSARRLCLAVFLSAPALLWAGSFVVSPVRVELAADQATVALTITNNEDEPLTAQLQTAAWSQADGEDGYGPTSDLIATPPLFKIAAKGSQIVRVGLRRAPDRAQELAYRLYVQEVPQPPKPGFQGVQVALRMSLPVFVAPAGGPAVPKLVWRARRESDGIRFTLKNEGNAHVQITGLQVKQGGQSVSNQNSIFYLLSGKEKTWLLRTNPDTKLTAEKLHLEASTDGGNVDTDLRLE